MVTVWKQKGNKWSPSHGPSFTPMATRTLLAGMNSNSSRSNMGISHTPLGSGLVCESEDLPFLFVWFHLIQIISGLADVQLGYITQWGHEPLAHSSSLPSLASLTLCMKRMTWEGYLGHFFFLSWLLSFLSYQFHACFITLWAFGAVKGT